MATWKKVTNPTPPPSDRKSELLRQLEAAVKAGHGWEITCEDRAEALKLHRSIARKIERRGLPLWVSIHGTGITVGVRHTGDPDLDREIERLRKPKKASKREK